MVVTTRDIIARNIANGILYCPCENCRARVRVVEKEVDVKLPPELKRAMERLRHELDTGEPGTIAWPARELLDELERLERNGYDDQLRRITSADHALYDALRNGEWLRDGERMAKK